MSPDSLLRLVERLEQRVKNGEIDLRDIGRICFGKV